MDSKNKIKNNESKCQLSSMMEYTFSHFADEIAVDDNEKKISYIEMKTMIIALQNIILQEKAHNKKFRVAVCMERNWAVIVAFAAILLSGCTYVPIDTSYPYDRKQLILKDANCGMIIADSYQRISSYSIPTFLFSGMLENGDGILNNHITDRMIAYIIYTSGSSGSPKGVEITIEAITNTIKWIKEQFSINNKDVVALKTSIGFTDSIVELLLPIICGATAKVIGDNDIHNMEKLFYKLCDVTIIQFVPPHLQMLLSYLRLHRGIGALPKLRWVLNGGQAIHMNLVNEFYDLLPQARIVNTYGMTEAAVYSTFHILKKGDLEAYIGGPITNMSVDVMIEDRRIEAPDVLGEICISGIGLMNGYINDPELTELKMPFSRKTEKRIYHTGDLGKWTEAGLLVYAGRIDDQIKINGKRVEINEVEKALAEYAPNALFALIAESDKSYSNKLICFYCGDSVEIDLIKLKLSTTLPNYMIPKKFIYLEKLPLTTNGKIDKKALCCEYRKKEEGIRVQIEGVWKAILPESSNNLSNDFFELGGDSLLAMKMIAMLDILGICIDYEFFRENPTIDQIIEKMQNEE